MKRKLLKPPAGNGAILFLPDPEGFITGITEETKIGVCHQPYFFNPGISLKFIFLELLPRADKKIIFLDTDKVNIAAKVPSSEDPAETIKFIDSELILSDFNNINDTQLNNFFNNYYFLLNNSFTYDHKNIISPFLTYRDIFLKNRKKRLLKEILAESFLEFYNIKREYYFLSDLIKGKEYRDFFRKIYKDSDPFRDIYNKAIDEFRKTFRFRYKNYPFPKLEEGELPFWIVHEGQRLRCFKKEIEKSNLETAKIFPRAVTLTIFLRIYVLDLFIHGIGGGNYEWIQDRIIERFFDKIPPPYSIISGTFLLENSKERDLPFFLFNPHNIKENAYYFLYQTHKTK
ncbi:MAG: hypothetical protein ACMUIU_09930 [bacterium]